MRKIILAMAAVFAVVSSGSLTPDAMAMSRPSATARKFAIVASVRTVAPMRPVEFGAVSSVLIAILAIRFTGPTGPMAESHSGEPTAISGGLIAEWWSWSLCQGTTCCLESSDSPTFTPAHLLGKVSGGTKKTAPLSFCAARTGRMVL